jgi:gamma-glutamyl hercynylcysteine S-oxide synthase
MNVLDDAAAIRRANADLLSLALMDTRNHLLAALALSATPMALRTAAHAGWYQEHWISCHLQRQRGEACDAFAPRLGGIEPRIEAWLMQPETPQAAPDAATVREYLAQTLDTTLDLLASAGADDAALHFYRQALLHEDRLGETLNTALLRASPPARAPRQALCVPAQSWCLGQPVGTPGLLPHNERGQWRVAVPEFEIDAQPVSWARYAEFAEDGGYDRRDCWTDAGWAALQAEGRRAPLHVEQLGGTGGAVLVERAGGVQRAAANQPAMHVNRFEAEAWCRWAGRRLATEPEWEIAAHIGAGLGFVWGDVFEWVAGSARAFPDAGPVAPGALDAVPADASGYGVLKGASFVTRRRWFHPRARRMVPFGHDTAYCGFRSCAL